MGATGRSFSWRSFRTLTRFMRLRISFLTVSSPTRLLSWSISSSKFGFSGSVVSGFALFEEPPEVCTLGLCFSVKLGSPLVTKSRGFRPSRDFRTPVVSQMAVRRSVHSVMYSASE